MRNKIHPWLRAIMLVIIAIFLFSCAASKKTLPTVPVVDYHKYLGKWYEIARLPNNFEKDMYCVTAEYSLKNKKRIRVFNSGYQQGKAGKRKSSTGTARVPNALKPGELQVSFFRPFWGDYYIIYLDEYNYQYALVGTPSREYLWILSRTPQMDEGTYKILVQQAERNGFDTSKMIKVKQNCNN
jgi:lipocalin